MRADDGGRVRGIGWHEQAAPDLAPGLRCDCLELWSKQVKAGPPAELRISAESETRHGPDGSVVLNP
jgi:hypothetical protein